jgi:hypothetical protein
MPSPERTKRTGIRNPRNGAHHAADHQVRIAKALRARLALEEIQQRVTRVIHAPRIPELGVALLAARALVRQWGGRAVRTWAFGFVLITCLICAGDVTASLSPHPKDRPPVGGTSLAPRAPVETRSGSSSGSQFNARKQPPSGAASQAGAAPPLRDMHSETSVGPRHHLALDIPGLPPAPDDPDLEAALSDLDKQADLDELMRQQHGLGQHPPVPTAGPPAAAPDGHAADAPPPATSTTAPAP